MNHASPQATSQRIESLLGFFGDMMLSQITGENCRRYVRHRGSESAARRDLEDLRSAINHYRKEGHLREVITVKLPVRSASRERWLTRSEAAKLLRAAWQYREKQMGSETERRPRQHVARFILVGLYGGRRAGAIVEASLYPSSDRGWVDTERGMFYPRAGLRQTKKRQPPIPLPRRLLAHMRRWKRNGQRHVIEWRSEPIARMAKAFRHTAREAGFTDVVPHTLRHTSATWMMQRGADIWSASGYLGMTPETLINTYGHHHPDHLKAAWSVFDRPGGEPKANRKAARKPKRQVPRQRARKRK